MASVPAPSGLRPSRKQHVQKVSDGRHAALAVLLLLEQGTPVQAGLDKYLRGATLKPQDRALCTELVYGFLRAEIRIDHLLQALLRNPQKLPREMYLALGLALYALLFLGRIPPHATVDWTVGHVRHRFGEALSKVANGALRSFVRLGDAPKLQEYYYREGASPAAAVYAEALFYSLPVWVVKLWDAAYGIEARTALCQRSMRPPYTGVRVNAMSPHAQELYSALLGQTMDLHPWPTVGPTTGDSTGPNAEAPAKNKGQAVGFSGVAFASGQSPRSVANAPLSYWQQQGDISFQSAGSQCVMQALEPRTWPSPVWDICAGQGGKTAILLEQGIVVALSTDVHRNRLESFTGNIRRFASAFSQHVVGAEGQGSAETRIGGDTSLVGLAEIQACFLPDAELLATAREKALAVLEAAFAAQGQIVPVLAYPPLVSKKSARDNDDNDGDDDYDGYIDDACTEPTAAPSPCAEGHGGEPDSIAPECSTMPPADASLTAVVASSTAFSVAHCPVMAPPNLPLVAMLDGCAVPPNSWSGTICIDAPCSGLGILSRRPDIRRRRNADSLPELIDLQARLLDAAWQALQVGGGLVYMTCTLNPAENEDQIQLLLRKYPQARLVRQWQTPHQLPWLEGMFGAFCIKAAH